MNIDDFRKELTRFADDIVDNIVSEIERVGAIRTGTLKNSIDYNIFIDSDGINIEFSMIEYGKFVDEGTIYIKAREFFTKIIERDSDRYADTLEGLMADYFET